MATRTERDRLERMLLGQESVLEEVHHLLYDEQKQDDLLRAMVLSAKDECAVRITGMDPDRIFHRETIQAMCIRYRLRFLPGGLFKGPVPSTAIYALRALERKATTPLKSFMVMAPASRFKLRDSEVDPLLFVPLGNDGFYLVHKWGNDLSVVRSLVNWPFRTPAHLATLVLVCAAIASALIPTHWMTTDPAATFWGAHRVLFFLWSTMVCASFTVFGWFAFFGQFSAEAWNSRYFN